MIVSIACAIIERILDGLDRCPPVKNIDMSDQLAWLGKRLRLMSQNYDPEQIVQSFPGLDTERSDTLGRSISPTYGRNPEGGFSPYRNIKREGN